jgi:4-carboxymuconolactone decarboxylase
MTTKLTRTVVALAGATLLTAIAADGDAGSRPPRFAPLTIERLNVYRNTSVPLRSTTHKVSDETFARAKRILGEQQVVDLTTVAGTYVTVAMLLAMAEEGVPQGKEPPFKAGEP